MGKGNPKSRRNFSLDRFLESEILQRSVQELTGSITSDGDHLIINPSPCTSGAVLRVHSSFVEVGESFRGTCDDGRQHDLRRLRIQREAPCLRIQAGRAQDFLERPGSFGDLPGSFLDLDVRVQNAKIKFNADGTGVLNYSNKAVPCLGKVDFPYKLDITNQGIDGTDKFKKSTAMNFKRGCIGPS